MKQLLLLFFFLFTFQFTNAQTWQPVYLQETLNYHSTAHPDEPIGIFAGTVMESFSNEDPNVMLALNADYSDQCAGWGCDSLCITLKAHFLQSRMVYLSDGVIAFQNPDTFYIHTQADVGDSWVFKNDTSGTEITATVTAIEQTEILGQPDSVKIITLSHGDEIRLSKLHGISEWVTATDTISLTSIPKRGLGTFFLTKSEVYDFNVGDVFSLLLNRKYEDLGDGNYGTLVQNWEIRRCEVLNVSENDSIREIEMTVNKFVKQLYQHHHGALNYSQNYSVDTVMAVVNLSSHQVIYDLPSNEYWYTGDYVNVEEDYWWGQDYNNSFNWEGLERLTHNSMTRVNNEMLNDRRVLGMGIKDFTFDIDEDANILDVLNADIDYLLNLDISRACYYDGIYESVKIPAPGDTLGNTLGGFWETFEMPTNYKLSIEGLGNAAFHAQQWYSIEIFEMSKMIMTGYKKGEESYGFIPEIHDLITLGVSDRLPPISFSVFPNPANEIVRVVLPSSDIGQLRILDISGRQVYTTGVNSENVEIKTSKFPSGIYFIQVETRDGTGVEKIIISH